MFINNNCKFPDPANAKLVDKTIPVTRMNQYLTSRPVTSLWEDVTCKAETLSGEHELSGAGELFTNDLLTSDLRPMTSLCEAVTCKAETLSGDQELSGAGELFTHDLVRSSTTDSQFSSISSAWSLIETVTALSKTEEGVFVEMFPPLLCWSPLLW